LELPTNQQSSNDPIKYKKEDQQNVTQSWSRDQYEEATPGTDGPSLIKQDNSLFLASIINEGNADKTPAKD
jgi:hypothetical protein